MLIPTERCVCWHRVCASVRASATKCMIMYRKKTDSARNGNFCTPIHVDKARSPAYLIQIVNERDIHFKGQNSSGIHWEVHRWTLLFTRVSIVTMDYIHRQDMNGCHTGLSNNSRSSQKARPRTIPTYQCINGSTSRHIYASLKLAIFW